MRAGFEFSVSPPEVLLRKDDDGRTVEPVEEVLCEVNDAQVGQVIESLSLRGAELAEMLPGAGEAGRTRIMLRCPARRGRPRHPSRFPLSRRRREGPAARRSALCCSSVVLERERALRVATGC